MTARDDLCQPPGVGNAGSQDRLQTRFRVVEGLSEFEKQLALIWMAGQDSAAFEGALRFISEDRNRERDRQREAG